MIRKIGISLLILASLNSCVSKKLYTELETKFADLKKENRKLSDDIEALTASKNDCEDKLKKLQEAHEKLSGEHDKLKTEFNAATNSLKTLQASYVALEKNSNESLEANMSKNRELLAKLEAKEKALAAEQDRLNKIKSELEANNKRLTELENLIASKETAMKKLKETLSKALRAFEGKGLTIEHKNGKVYVSMENKLLFQTGSWAVGVEGRKAVVELGKVLAQNPDLSVLIEGHTDNDKYLGAVGGIESNWDLSTKRATSIVNILIESKGIVPLNLTAAGRGEFAPIMSNDTPEGKAKNRRIEIIITPKLDEVDKLLNEL
ncbi:MAG: cell envelope biogenesis protein OmpA [Flavobacterium sp. BFFFF2]|nr:MAG: cell envelope biogenesis protein OmpA [Flavobacterium sp. BFFFF2]